MKEKNVIYTGSGIPIKVNKKLGIGYIIAALFFLFNPDINIIDLLPDVFGYMLLCAGLSKLSFVDSSFEEAANRFKKMIFVSFGKLVSFVLLFSLFNERERPYGFLLFTFSFLVLDLIFLLPAVKSMFEGFMQLTRKYKSEVAYKTRKSVESANNETEGSNGGRRKAYIEKIYRFTMVFFILKAILRTLPEFTALTMDEYTDGSFVMYMYEYINMYRILGAIIALVIGIVWLCRSCRFFVKLSRENAFIENVKNELVEKAITREGLFVKKAIKTALLLFGVGALLSIDFHVSIALETVMIPDLNIHEITINLIPDFVFAILFFSAAFILRNYIKFNKKLILASSVYMAFSLVASALKVYFATAYGSFSAVNYIGKAFTLFYVICTSTIFENIAFVAMMAVFALFMKELIKSYTGYIPSVQDPTTAELINSTHKELTTKVWIVFALSVISAITASVYDFMLIEIYTMPFARSFWIIDFVAQAAFACVSLHALFEINDEVESRYMLS